MKVHEVVPSIRLQPNVREITSLVALILFGKVCTKTKFQISIDGPHLSHAPSTS